MKVSDVLSLAYRSIRSHKLRTGITVAIIAIGITALIGFTTAIQAMNEKLMESFSTMGANGFTIRFKERNFRIGGGGGDVELSKKGAKKQKQSSLNKVLTEDESELFVKRYQFPGATVGLSTFSGRNNIVSYQSSKTSPNVLMMGGDENYLFLNGFSLLAGRNFSKQEIQSAQNICLLGYDVASKLFKLNRSMAVNHVVRINDVPYRVIGVLASRGSSFGFSRDNLIVIGYKSVEKFSSNNSYTIGVKIDRLNQVTNAMGEAEGVFRAIRKLNTTEESNFVVERSDSVAEKAINVLSYLTAAIVVIGFITLIGSAIGLMNIMLVSVTERTKEVGLIKAIGGKSKTVRQQFLSEAILISLLGAFFGVVLGLLFGNFLAVLLSAGFTVPWKWIGYGIAICGTVGLLAGLYPALKAGKLNPIDALRYE
ncbi:MAG: ABC transporter permease [Flavisolibacter sp.]|nr:ABC transporter permease [Flavisolibacter sp.]